MNDTTQFEPTSLIPAPTDLDKANALLAPDGLKTVIAAVRRMALAQPSDVSTPKGREMIKSTAYQVSRTKTAIAALADHLSEDARVLVKRYTTAKGAAAAALDALRDEIRKPVELWEAEDKKRRDGHSADIENIISLSNPPARMTADLMRKRLETILAFDPSTKEEFSSIAEEAKQEAISRIEKAIADAEEAQRLRDEAARQAEEARKQRELAEAQEAENRRLREELAARQEADDRRAAEEKAAAELALRKEEVKAIASLGTLGPNASVAAVEEQVSADTPVAVVAITTPAEDPKIVGRDRGEEAFAEAWSLLNDRTEQDIARQFYELGRTHGIALVKALFSNPHVNLGDLIYKVRDSEGDGWDGPWVTQWGEAVKAAEDAIKEFTKNNPPES
jgi:colicin import membrane protein